MKNKVVIIGCGNVGMSYAYALVNQKTVVTDLYLIDLNKERVEGEVMDLRHCLPYAPNKMNIQAGEYSDVKDADIVVIASGANQLPGETRMDLIYKNSKIFKEVVGKVMENGFDGVFLVVTNPLDVMTQLTYKYSGLPAHRVIGSGTFLDTSRLKYLIGEKTHINPKSVHGYVIGEHGDSEFVPWSCANVGLQSIDDFLSEAEKQEISEKVRNAAYEIINKKGNTSYGIGVCLVKITNAILTDERSVMVVSNYDKNNDVYIGMPAIIGKNGVVKKIWFTLTEEEEAKLSHSISVIKEAVDKVL